MARDETQKNDTVSKFKRRHGNSATNLKRAHVTKSIIDIIMRKEKASIYKSSNLPLQACEKNHSSFLLHDTGAGSSPRNNFANLGFSEKVPVSVESVVTWIES